MECGGRQGCSCKERSRLFDEKSRYLEGSLERSEPRNASRRPLVDVHNVRKANLQGVGLLLYVWLSVGKDLGQERSVLTTLKPTLMRTTEVYIVNPLGFKVH